VIVLVGVDNEVGKTVSEISACAVCTERPALRVFGDGLYRSLDCDLEI